MQGRWRGFIFATLAIGSAAVPLGAGQLVDRLMATEKFLALTYALGTGLLVVLASGMVSQAGWLFVLFLLFWSLIGPSYSMCNSLAMRNLDDPGREFGWVRLWGTAGWMGAGWLVSLIMAFSGSTRVGEGAFEALWVAAAVSAVVSVYCLTLPHTPPLAVGPRGQWALRESPRTGSPAGRVRFSDRGLRRLPDGSPGLSGHAGLSRNAGIASGLDLVDNDPGTIDARLGCWRSSPGCCARLE